MPSGCFATANTTGNEVVFWSAPSEECSIITKAATRLTIGNTSEHVCRSVLCFDRCMCLFHYYFISNCSMWGLGNRGEPLIAVARKDPSQAINTCAVDVFDCKDFAGIKAAELCKS